ncbi:hypothetical protein FTX61_16880 [Nitriliruptoraceae bacterium ZYF776]|nr:hypothetical protein [Profundirhabdus halotolerans]
MGPSRHATATRRRRLEVPTMRRLPSELSTTGPTPLVAARDAWDALALAVEAATDRDRLAAAVDRTRTHVGLAPLGDRTPIPVAQRGFALAHARGLRAGVHPPATSLR